MSGGTNVSGTKDHIKLTLYLCRFYCEMKLKHKTNPKFVLWKSKILLLFVKRSNLFKERNHEKVSLFKGISKTVVHTLKCSNFFQKRVSLFKWMNFILRKMMQFFLQNASKERRLFLVWKIVQPKMRKMQSGQSCTSLSLSLRQSKNILIYFIVLPNG
jgi:hypothetical protein